MLVEMMSLMQLVYQNQPQCHFLYKVCACACFGTITTCTLESMLLIACANFCEFKTLKYKIIVKETSIYYTPRISFLSLSLSLSFSF